MVDELRTLPVDTNKSEFNAVLGKVSKLFGIINLHQEQEQAINAFFDGNDVFVSLPTGYGKSFVYQSIPVIATLLLKKPFTIFIISPLKAIMEDQVQYLNGLGSNAVSAVALTEESDEIVMEKVMDGHYTHVFGSPECFLARESWRDLFDSPFKQQLIGVAVDEAHCISHWGASDARRVAFREWFSNIGELRSLIPESAKLVVVTATATKATRMNIFETLHLGKEPLVIERSPDRPNLKYSAVYIKARMPFEQMFRVVIENLKENGVNMERTMIYCQTRKQTSIIFRTFAFFLGAQLFHGDQKPKNRIVEMYHAGTPSSVKKHIVDDLSTDGHIRCLITTIAFGMGVDCKKVRKIYHMGSSKNIECYVQESGRGGRDGMPAVCILLYNGILSNHCEQDIKDYCKTETCRRDTLFKPFDVKPKQVMPKHDCCDNCAINCSCGAEDCGKAFYMDISKCLEVTTLAQAKTRPVTTEQKASLANALKAYRKEEVNKYMAKVKYLVSCPNILLELGDFFIDQVVDNCHKIFMMKDVFNYVEVWRREHAAAILNIISVCFGDIEMVAELNSDLLCDENFIDMDWKEVLDDTTLMDMADSFNEDSTLTDGETIAAATSLNTSSFLKSIANNLA